ncbi:hypothetical protein [Segatella copri]|nr:hypothetical protein [Segatella copri]
MEVKGTLKYRKVQRTPQTGENAGKKKWYATSVTDRVAELKIAGRRVKQR